MVAVHVGDEDGLNLHEIDMELAQLELCAFATIDEKVMPIGHKDLRRGVSRSCGDGSVTAQDSQLHGETGRGLFSCENVGDEALSRGDIGLNIELWVEVLDGEDALHPFPDADEDERAVLAQPVRNHDGTETCGVAIVAIGEVDNHVGDLISGEEDQFGAQFGGGLKIKSVSGHRDYRVAVFIVDFEVFHK